MNLKLVGAFVIVISVAIVIVIYLNQDKENRDNNLRNDEVLNENTDYSNLQFAENQEIATFAPGCFWCMEAVTQETEGVYEVISGYAGGEEVDPTYEDVYKERTGHREAVQVYYDPDVISFEEILDIFWKNIDPTDAGGQFADRGFSYTTAIFYDSAEQRTLAEETRSNLEESEMFEKPIVTVIEPFTSFYPAEEYHQDYYQKSSTRYNLYKNASGREDFKEKIWEEIQKENN